MSDIIVFGGTTEGRKLTEFLYRQKVKAHICVATSYGGKLLPQGESVTVSDIPLEKAEMEALFRREKPRLVVDGTHPYAVRVTAQIRQACQDNGIPYLRLLRGDTEERRNVITVDSVEEAVAYLAKTEGTILVTTGSKELAAYTGLDHYKERVIARVLSTREAMEQCKKLGFEGKNLICMQGPFSEEMNRAILEQYHCRYLVTKASGSAGGYEEKIEAALSCGCQPIVIGRPEEESGYSYLFCKKIICEKLDLHPVRQISLVGIGPGGLAHMTEAGKQAVQKAELLVGAQRMVEAVRTPGQDSLTAYEGETIRRWLEAHAEYERIAIVVSGDTGFYSGAKKIRQALAETSWKIHYIPGISSIAYFTARLQTSWDDALLLSGHGRQVSAISAIRDHKKVLMILGKQDSVREIAVGLRRWQMEDVLLSVGERLSYQDEKITTGTAKDFLNYENDPLCVLMLENPKAEQTRRNPLVSRKDTEFIRGPVPMTKEEIRLLSIAKLGLVPDAVCYDIGAGTGSVSVEMAIRACRGRVYGIEKKAEALSLLEANRKKFALDNLEIVNGTAPEALKKLPAPTHVFIGGTSGNLEGILEAVFSKNPSARVVINCIALESCAAALECVKKYSDGQEEILQVSVSKGRRVGPYTMMNGENPITIFAFTGRGERRE